MVRQSNFCRSKGYEKTCTNSKNKKAPDFNLKVTAIEHGRRAFSRRQNERQPAAGRALKKLAWILGH
jgi:hypothetical protein